VVGLGNPGREYERTRHNLGFRVVDELARRAGVHEFRRHGSKLVARMHRNGDEALLIKPMTYMNRSGQAVQELTDRHVDEDLIVVHDDLDLEFGTVRVKRGGGHGGHNGLRSILEEAEAGDFLRVRLGIGRDDQTADAADWVLEPFPAEQEAVVKAMIERGADAAEATLLRGAQHAMNTFNRRDVATGC